MKTSWLIFLIAHISGACDVPKEFINDDYCDCDDMTDEPLTSACQDSRFICLNAGFIPAQILSSRVFDSICDPECCDGSDEQPGVCPNTCQQRQVEHIATQHSLKTTMHLGAVARRSLIAAAKQQRLDRTSKIKKLQDDLLLLSQKQDRLSISKEEAERLEAVIADQEFEKYQLTCPGTLIKLDADYRGVVAKAIEIQGKYVKLVNGLAALSAPEGATVTQLQGLLVDHNYILGEPVLKIPEVLEVRSPRYNPCDSSDGSVLACMTDSTNKIYKKAIASISLIISPMSDLVFTPDEEKLIQNPEKARNALKAATENTDEVEKQIEELRAKDGLYFGPRNEWESLHGRCFKHDTTEYIVITRYTYELCSFGKASQISRKDSSSTDLGTFSRWGDRDDENKYSTMFYENGMSCWNGPARSVLVILECAADTVLVSIEEPNKCEYTMILKTPAVCPVDGELEDHQEL